MQIIQIPVLTDNYIYLINGGGQTAVVDPALSAPVLSELKKNNWQLDYILNTHHHGDHVGGNLQLKAASGAKVVGYKGDAKRIPGIDIELEDGDIFNVCGADAEVMFIPGHTLGHIAYYFVSDASLFCGDTVFSLGCGRLFEGTPEQMFTSITKIKALPRDTKIYCAHEYTQNNGRFAETIILNNNDLKDKMQEVNELRAAGKPTIPTILDVELKTNPFLLADNVAEFTKWRKIKDGF